jgi:hypothetical protein
VAGAQWDQGKWDADTWGGPVSGWHGDWQFWYQVGNSWDRDLTPLVVEARWTTDAQTLGDGTFAGDIQPGKCTIQLKDPGRTTQNPPLDRLGAVWAQYLPTGACWCWFYDTVSRGLYAPGDPLGADVVFQGVTWPARLTGNTVGWSVPAQPVSTRLGTIVSYMNSGLNLPTVTGAIATQNQLVTAITWDTGTSLSPGVLDALRTAGSPGRVWLEPTRVGRGGPGSLILHYDRWETVNVRPILSGWNVIAGPTYDQSVGFVVAYVTWNAVKGDTGAQSSSTTGSTNTYGTPRLTMRMNGDVTFSTGPESSSCITTASSIIAKRTAGTQYASAVSVTSGDRRGAGGTLTHPWDPSTHVYKQSDSVQVNQADGSSIGNYRVAKTDHRLTATTWESVHTLDMYVQATALP